MPFPEREYKPKFNKKGKLIGFSDELDVNCGYPRDIEVGVENNTLYLNIDGIPYCFSKYGARDFLDKIEQIVNNMKDK